MGVVKNKIINVRDQNTIDGPVVDNRSTLTFLTDCLALDPFAKRHFQFHSSLLKVK